MSDKICWRLCTVLDRRLTVNTTNYLSRANREFPNNSQKQTSHTTGTWLQTSTNRPNPRQITTQRGQSNSSQVNPNPGPRAKLSPRTRTLPGSMGMGSFVVIIYNMPVSPENPNLNSKMNKNHYETRVNSPLTILNRLEPFLSQLDASVNFERPLNVLYRQILICPISDFLSFGKMSLIHFFSLKGNAYMWAFDPLWYFFSNYSD